MGRLIGPQTGNEATVCVRLGYTDPLPTISCCVLVVYAGLPTVSDSYEGGASSAACDSYEGGACSAGCCLMHPDLSHRVIHFRRNILHPLLVQRLNDHVCTPPLVYTNPTNACLYKA